MRMHVTRSWSRQIAAAALAVAAITGVSACSSSTPTSSSTQASDQPTGSSTQASDQPTSGGTRASGEHLAAIDFSTALKEPDTIVLDVRTPAEFADGHLPQAQNIDIEGQDFATQIAALDKNANYAVYCHSGNRSGVALERMAAADLTHAYDLAGGIGAWQSMGGPMVTGGP